MWAFIFFVSYFCFIYLCISFILLTYCLATWYSLFLTSCFQILSCNISCPLVLFANPVTILSFVTSRYLALLSCLCYFVLSCHLFFSYHCAFSSCLLPYCVFFLIFFVFNLLGKIRLVGFSRGGWKNQTSTEVLRRSPQWAFNTHTHTHTEWERDRLTSRP